MMRRTPLLLIAVLALVLTCFRTATAEDLLKYSFLDASYQFADFKDFGGDGGHGFRGALSVSPIEHLFLVGRANVSSADGDIDAENIDFFRLRVGGGGYIPLGSPFHLTGEAGVTYTDYNTEIDSLRLSEAGFYLTPGVRVSAAGVVEFAAGATFSTVENETVTFNIGAGLNFLEHFQFNGEVEIQEEVNLYSLGFRLQW